MSNDKNELRKCLRSYKIDFGVLCKTPCSKEETKEYKQILKEGGSLPEGVFAVEYLNGSLPDEFYTVTPAGLDDAEIKEYLMYKKLSMLKTVKNCLVFLAGLAAFYLFLFLISMLF